MLKFRSNADDYTAQDAAHYGISFSLDEGMTQPEFLADCDINTIISRYQAVQAPLPISDISEFLDYSNVGDYQTALQSISAVEGYFDALPATIRARFSNDPGQLLAFLDDPNNRGVAEALGLVDRPAVPVVLAAGHAVAVGDTGGTPPAEGASPPQVK